MSETDMHDQDIADGINAAIHGSDSTAVFYRPFPDGRSGGEVSVEFDEAPSVELMLAVGRLVSEWQIEAKRI